MSPGKLVDEKDVGCQDKSGPGKMGVYINAKFAINSHCSYKKNLAIKSLCIFYKPRI